MPFYSDQQRRFFFAVIAPMQSWGLGAVTHAFLDPLVGKLGLKPEERDDIQKELEERVKDSRFIKVFKKTDVGRLEKADLTDVLRDKLEWMVADTLDTPTLRALGVREVVRVLTPAERKIRKPRFSKKSWGEERRNEDGAFTHHHNGIDIAADRGAPIRPARNGVVVYTGTRSGYGKVVDILGEDGHIHRFAHLDEYAVRVGDNVTADSYVGRMGVGFGAVHLHYEKRKPYHQKRDGTTPPYDDVQKMQPHEIKELKTARDVRFGFSQGGDPKSGKDKKGRALTPNTLNPTEEGVAIAERIHRDLVNLSLARNIVRKVMAEQKKDADKPATKPKPKPKAKPKPKPKPKGGAKSSRAAD